MDAPQLTIIVTEKAAKRHRFNKVPNQGFVPTSKQSKAVFLCEVTKGTVTDSQQLGCLSAHAPGSVQRSLQVTLLSLRNHALEIDSRIWELHALALPEDGNNCWGCSSDPIGQNPKRDFRATFQGNRALNRVFQFTDITRPIVGLQTTHGLE